MVSLHTRTGLAATAVVLGVLALLMTPRHGEAGSHGIPDARGSAGTNPRSVAPVRESLHRIDPHRFEAEVRGGAFTAIPDGWNVLAILLHATNVGRSEHPGIELSRPGVEVDDGRSAFVVPWDHVGSAYVLHRADPGPVLCLMTADDRPICLPGVAFEAPEEVASAINRTLNELPRYDGP